MGFHTIEKSEYGWNHKIRKGTVEVEYLLGNDSVIRKRANSKLILWRNYQS